MVPAVQPATPEVLPNPESDEDGQIHDDRIQDDQTAVSPDVPVTDDS